MGVQFTEAEQKQFQQAGHGGRIFELEMTPGGKITRIVQYNAVNKNFDFLFTPEQRQQRQQERAAKAEQDDNRPLKARKTGEVWVRPVQGGVELTREQFKTLCENKPVFVEGMVNQTAKPKQEQGVQQVETTDQKGQKYNAWVWPDQEAGRIRHTSLPPEQWKEAQAKKQAEKKEQQQEQRQSLFFRWINTTAAPQPTTCCNGLELPEPSALRLLKRKK